ncbi:MAG: dockerin type I repeat-containing protein [Phycisphaerales bacterium]|nr:dockerin type I repeat-containing protein [Phycisphaerales bacterium]
MNRTKLFGVSACAGLVAASGASAQLTAYDNLGPGNEFDATHGMVTRGPDASTLSPWAAFFGIPVEASGGIVEVSFPLLLNNQNNLFWFQVYQDDFGQIGPLVGEHEVFADPNIGVSTFQFDGSINLEQGTTYWIGIMPGPASHGTWHWNNFGETRSRWAWRGPDTWSFFSSTGMAGLRIMVDAAGPTCPPDLNGDGVVDADDFFLFLQLFADGDLRADFNNDGVIDADDFFEFLNAFAQGC